MVHQKILCLEHVSRCGQESIWIVIKLAETNVALLAKQSSNAVAAGLAVSAGLRAARVVMIDVPGPELTARFGGAANGALSTLSSKKSIEVVYGETIAIPQELRSPAF